MPVGMSAGAPRGFLSMQAAEDAIDAPAGISSQQLQQAQEDIIEITQTLGAQVLINPIPRVNPTRIVSSRKQGLQYPASVRPVYNFFVENYQALATSTEVSALQLPNLYNETLLTEERPDQSINFDQVQPDEILAQEKDLIIDPVMLKRWDTLSSGKSQYPMYIETFFSTEVAGSISRLLGKTNLFPAVIKHFIINEKVVTGARVDGVGTDTIYRFDGGITSLFNRAHGSNARGCISAREKINLVIAQRKITEVLQEPHREVLFYRINKISDNKIIQSIYVPNLAELDEFNYVDTQVKYDTEYRYTIQEYFVVGDGNSAYLAAAPLAFEVLEGRHAGATDASSLFARIIDHPPVAPNVSIIPFRGVDNRVLINLGRMTDDLTGNNAQKYIPLMSGDEEKFINTHNSQKITNPDLPTGHVEFRAEGADTQIIEVFRTTNLPSQPNPYKAFLNQRHARVHATKGLSLTDDLIPNQEYFYTFRSVDQNNGMSNPSSIYRVRMINDRGVVTHEIDVYDPEPLPFKKRKKSLGRKIFIKPSLLQSMIDDEGVTIGVLSDSVFGKKLKIRLTSKSTGRKIDLNLKFIAKQ
jgi:hypothetical protein